MRRIQMSWVVRSTVAATGLAALAVFATACGDSQQGLGKLLQKDPRGSFEAFMKSYLSNLQLAMDEEDKVKGEWRHQVMASSTRYDVQKSTSLVAPYDGVITVNYTFQYNSNGKWDAPLAVTVNLKFGFRDGKWEPVAIITDKGESRPFGANETYYWKAYEKTPQ
jgi:hypothetical protein